MAATRFYLPSTGAAAVSPAFDGSWESTGSADRLRAVTTRISSSATSKAVAETNASTSYDVLVRQYVSDPIHAQTVAGNVKGRIRASESNAAADMRAQVLIRVVSGDGTTVRGTLLAHDAAALANEFVLTTLTNRQFPRGASVALSSVVAQEGDRIVMEVGYRAHNSVTTSYTGTLNFGDNSGTDLPEDETATAANNPWIEFDQDLFSDIAVPSGIITLSGGPLPEEVYPPAGIVTLTGPLPDPRDEISESPPTALVTLTAPPPAVVDGIFSARPFDFGGVGLIIHDRPFWFEAPAQSALSIRPFDFEGVAEVTSDRLFDFEGLLVFNSERPFDFIEDATETQGGVSLPQGSTLVTTLTADAFDGDTTITIASTSGIQPGDTIQIGPTADDPNAISVLTVDQVLSGTQVVLREAVGTFIPSGTSVTGLSGFQPYMAVFSKGGVLLGLVPYTEFVISQVPSRVINDSGTMTFYISRKSPYRKLIADDRIVYLSAASGIPPWAGSMRTQDYGEAKIQVMVEDCTYLLDGGKAAYDAVLADSTPAYSVAAKALALHNNRAGLDGEVVWAKDLTGSLTFRGDAHLQGSMLAMLADIVSNSGIEWHWRANFVNDKLRLVLVVRDSFDAGEGAALSDSDGGNLAAGPRISRDPESVYNEVKVVGQSTTIADYLPDWARWAVHEFAPEVTVTRNPGIRRRRSIEVVVPWSLSRAAQQALALRTLERVRTMYQNYVRAWHDQYGRPYHPGYEYHNNPPEDVEQYINTGQGWRTRAHLVEVVGVPGAAVMHSTPLKQLLVVTYDRVSGYQNVRRYWWNQSGILYGTRMRIHGYAFMWDVQGGVIVGRIKRPYDHSGALVGPPVKYWWPDDPYSGPGGSYKTLRRVISLSEDGAVAEGEYHDMSVPEGPTTGVFYPLGHPLYPQPIFTRPTIGDAPYKTFSPELLPDWIDMSNSFNAKVYDFEEIRINQWDPRRDGIGTRLNRRHVRLNQPSTQTRWVVTPWGTGVDGSTSLTQGISATETKILVDSIFTLPTTYPYTAAIGADPGLEVVRVVSAYGPLLTVRRGINGTTAIIHEAGESFQVQTVAEPWDGFAFPFSWPEGRSFANALLDRSKLHTRITAHLANVSGAWRTIRIGSTHDITITTEAKPAGYSGRVRVIGFAPSFATASIELITEEIS